MNTSSQPLLICGSSFGALYTEAAQKTRHSLLGIFGKGSERSQSVAQAHHVPLYTQYEAIPPIRKGSGLAAVIVRSPLLGGESVEVASQLMEYGWNTLLEGPLSKDDLVTLSKNASRYGVSIHIGNHYRNLTSFISFAQAARELIGMHRNGIYLDITCSSHVLFHVFGLASEFIDQAVLSIDHTETVGPLRVTSGMLGKLPCTLRVHNEVDADNSDFNAQMLCGFTLVTRSGVLRMDELGAEVTWHPALNFKGTDKRGLPCTDHPADVYQTADVASQLIYDQWISETWVEALAEEINVACDKVFDPAQMARALLIAENWQKASKAIGFPTLITNEDQPAKPFDFRSASLL